MKKRSDVVPLYPHREDGSPISQKYDEAYCQQVRDLAQEGLFPEEWCAHLGVTMATIYNWCNRYPEFDEAVTIAWHLLAAYWGKQARIAAKGGSGFTSPTIMARVLERRFPHIWGPNRAKLTQEHFENRNVVEADEKTLEGIPTDEAELQRQLDEIQARFAEMEK